MTLLQRLMGASGLSQARQSMREETINFIFLGYFHPVNISFI